jgi:SAM-dependent methyltransferase
MLMKEISGDIKLSKKEQIQYLLHNFFRGIWGYRTFLKSQLWSTAQTNQSSDSPGRQYVDSFLKTEIPNLISKKEISVLDIGCGTAYVLKILEELEYSGEYTGVDIFKEPGFLDESEKFKIDFVQKPIEEFEINKKFDLVISNTSFEHIPDDKKAAEQASKFVKDDGVQIHIMPSFGSFFAYLFHGYRQYNPTFLKRIFPKNMKVYRLGGFFSFLTTLFLMTIPERFLGKYLFKGKKYPLRKTKFYPKVLSFANKADRVLPIMSMFYVVVIKK